MGVTKFQLKSNRNFYFFFFLLFLSNCSITGITNDYNKLSEEEKKFVLTFTSFKSVKNNRVYKINGIELKKELKQNDRSLVVLVSNGCSSKYCIPLSNYIFYTKKNNLNLYIIIAGYDDLYKTLNQEVNAPLFSIDNKYYNTIFRNKYLDKFTLDLMGYKYQFNKGNMIFFKKDSVIAIKRSFDE